MSGIGVLDGLKIALGGGLDAISGEAEGAEVLAGGAGATFTEAEVVFGGAFPVAMALEEETLAGVLLKILVGGGEFGALGGLDGGLVKIEVNGFQQAADGEFVFEHAVAQSEAVGGRIEEPPEVAAVDVARIEHPVTGTAEAHGGARIGTVGLFSAARENEGGDDKEEAELLGSDVHGRRKDVELTLSGNGFDSASFLTAT